jgi:glucose/arabinose dehydrogenase
MTNSLYFWVAVGWLWLATSLASAQVLKDPALMVTEVVAGLNAPTVMAFIGPDDILVLKKNDGQVRRVIGGVLQPTPVLDVAVNQLSERGLLGMALHPAFQSTAWVYLYYTESSTGGDSQDPSEHGTVSDQTTGAALEAVSVAAWHVDPAPVTRINTSTDAAGLYALGDLRPGHNWVFFAHSGY